MSYETLSTELAKAILDPYNGNKLYVPVVEIPATGVSLTGLTIRNHNPDHIIQWAVPYLMTLAATQEAASAMTDMVARNQVRMNADAAIAQFMDDYCGTPSRVIPWPYPGPLPWVSAIASQLTIEANRLQDGPLKSSLIGLVGQLMDRLFLNPQPLPPRR